MRDGESSRSGKLNKAMSKQQLIRAIQFFTERVADARHMQRNIVKFTGHCLKDIIEFTEKSPSGASAVNILWHDFLFIFFQFFLGKSFDSVSNCSLKFSVLSCCQQYMMNSWLYSLAT